MDQAARFGCTATSPERSLRSLRERKKRVVDHTDQLHRLTSNNARLVDDESGAPRVSARAPDRKSLTLVRLAALVAAGGAVCSMPNP